MRYIFAVFKFLAVVFLITLGTLFVFLVGWLPIYKQKIHVNVWVTYWLCHIIFWMVGIKLDFPPQEEVMAHEGLFFANHCSYFDILAMSYMMPLRYLAKAEVTKWPLIGFVAKQIGCVFVERSKKESRKEARLQIGEVGHYPPMVLYPEGRRNDGYSLLPFRYGAFEIAIDKQIPFTPVVVVYDQQEIFASPSGENIVLAIWRILSYAGPLTAQVHLLETVKPAPDADPIMLAEETRAAILKVLMTEGAYHKEGDAAAGTQGHSFEEVAA